MFRQEITWPLNCIFKVSANCYRFSTTFGLQRDDSGDWSLLSLFCRAIFLGFRFHDRLRNFPTPTQLSRGTCKPWLAQVSLGKCKFPPFLANLTFKNLLLLKLWCKSRWLALEISFKQTLFPDQIKRPVRLDLWTFNYGLIPTICCKCASSPLPPQNLSAWVTVPKLTGDQ